MKTNESMNLYQNPVCIGTGLVALDVIISGNQTTPTQFLAGGSCGNVITILSYLGWSTYPIARLSNNVAAELLLEDLKFWNVNDTLLSINDDGSTPVIIHRIMKDQQGAPKHRFEFRNPEDGRHLPSYKACLAKSVPDIFAKKQNPNVFYFDRINRASIELAKLYKAQGSIIFFEPSSTKDTKGFNECMDIADVVKFSDDRIINYEEMFPQAKAGLEIQTMGNRGLRFRKKNQTKWTLLSGYSIDNVVDAAGAGDWCTSGIIINLFKNPAEINNLSDNDIIFALQFGQALSALNCTFEGARGLMYNIKRSELLLYIQHIISSNLQRIPQSRNTNSYEIKKTGLKISSLFAAV
ncbi:MAG: carbohydrate kinase [Mucilaginibacter sp.]|nr:carbohydrate kinase [Mucilaginibacter sp.]